ncbi:MAG: hypothetical protein WCI27_11090 [Candidatus Omnitrophota bacterium]
MLNIPSLVRRITVWFVLAAFIATGVLPPRYASAQQVAMLPLPGTRVELSPAFKPPLLKGIKVYPDFVNGTPKSAILNDVVKQLLIGIHF